MPGADPCKNMQRREARLRKEYLYRKSLEEKERRLFEQKSRLKKSLDSSEPIPHDLRNDAVDLAKKLAYDEAVASKIEIPQYVVNYQIYLGPKTSIDDEYAKSSLKDPKILVTTSRDPSSRLTQFAKEIRLVFPNSQRINRGNHVISEVVSACKTNEVTDLIILHEHRGIPDGMIVSHFPYGPTAYFSLHNVVLRHDIKDKDQKTISEAYPHLIFSNFSSKLGSRVMSILQHLFPVPKPDSKRIMTFANSSDFISFRYFKSFLNVLLLIHYFPIDITLTSRMARRKSSPSWVLALN